MFKKVIIPFVILAAFTLLWGCKENHELELATGQLQIIVKEQLNNNSGIKAFLFLNDSLYGNTDLQGIYENNFIKSGKYTLTCSAINFRDTTLSITIDGGEATTLHFNLLPDTSVGTVFGEFENLQLYNQKVVDNPQLKTWSEQEMYDGITGATMYKVAYPDPYPPRTVSLGDSIITKSNGFGQYWFVIQAGTYQITGACDGYTDTTRIIKVLPQSVNYFNFFLRKK